MVGACKYTQSHPPLHKHHTVPTASPKTTPGKVGSTPNKGQGDDDDDDWDMKKGGKKGGKKKAAGAKGKGGKGGTTASKVGVLGVM